MNTAKQKSPAKHIASTLLVVLVAALFTLGLFIYSHGSWHRVVQEESLELNSIRDVKLLITEGHLWFEEMLLEELIVKDDQYLMEEIWIKNVWSYFEKANDKLNYCIKSEEESIYIDDDLIRELKKLKTSLNQLVNILKERWQKRESTVVDSSLKAIFDKTFSEMIKMADYSEKFSKEHLQKGIEKQQSRYVASLIFWGFNFVAACITIFIINKKRVKVEEQLAKTNEELTAANEEMNAINEELLIEIAKREQLEENQAELIKKLKNTNHELNDFAYIVSHDLKAPLRAMNLIVSWLSTDYSDKFDEVGKEQLNLLVKRAKRMNDLIDGVLLYSKLGRVKEEETEVNLNTLVADVIESISPPENIEIKTQSDMPTIICDRIRIMQVLQNLIGNAVKFMDKPKGEIKIGCTQDSGYWKFNVSDNGHGIEERHFKKIFKIFQTVQPAGKSESTGIGLTIVKKIVELYGGNIWVESKVGSGSTFFFTLPKKKGNNLLSAMTS